MTLVLIIGPPAVGKMTVGHALAEMTDLRLFYNHMSIELVLKFFDFDTPEFERLDKTIRFAVFEEIANSHLAGVIFTLVWDYNLKEDEVYVDEIIEVFKANNAQICLVELNADVDVRLERNKSEERLKQKPSKRDLEWSEKSLLSFEKRCRMVSRENEFDNKQIYKIDNTNLSPTAVAQMIKTKFNL